MNDNRPPTGGGTGRRSRPRYAPDAEVKRALRLAREEGLNPAGFTLDANGGVTVLDSVPGGIPRVAGEGTADDALAEWEAKEAGHGHSRHA